MNSFLTAVPIAHRGLHDEEKPENTLPAFEAAIKHGYAIETDVRFTKDRQLVVFHDDTLLRMAADSRPVSGCTLEELKAIRLACTREHIPTLRELLDCVNGRAPLLIEMKNMGGVKAEEIAGALVCALEGYRGKYAVQSFQPFYVKAFKKLRPDILCGVLGTAATDVAGAVQRFVVKHLPFNFTVKPDFVSYRLEDLPRKPVTNFKGIRLAWVVRSKEDEARAREFVDNIIFEDYLP